MPHDDASEADWDLGVAKLLCSPSCSGAARHPGGTPPCWGSQENTPGGAGQAGEGWAEPPRGEEGRGGGTGGSCPPPQDLLPSALRQGDLFPVPQAGSCSGELCH